MEDRNIGNLYFEDVSKLLHTVQENISQKETYRKIAKFVKSIRPDFKIYYIRTWKNQAENTIYDFGSHSEFFIFKITK